MRISNLLRGLLVVFAAISPLVLHAQFQPPNPDELKMTSDPKAPGADAVYLDFEENDSDARQSHNYYARIKVLTEKGKEAATVEIPYYGGAYSIGSVSGRTIHPDGSILELEKDAIFERALNKTGDLRIKSLTFTLPGVEPGSIISTGGEMKGISSSNDISGLNFRPIFPCGWFSIGLSRTARRDLIGS